MTTAGMPPALLEQVSPELAPVETAVQINLHPFDAAHAAFILPHQLRVWGGQVERILLSLDGSQASAGRYRGEDFAAAERRLLEVVDGLRGGYPHLVLDQVDDGARGRALVTRRFFAESPTPYPHRAFDGGPFHVYFYGIARANARYVLHMDSDMLFGGGSPTWLAQAIALFASHPDALCIAPFSGPPTASGDLDPACHVGMPGVRNPPAPRKLQGAVPTWRFSTVSTRIFAIDMQRFAQRVGSLDALRPDLGRRLRAVAYNQSPLSMPAEEVLSATMIRRGLYRLDFLGDDAGMYSLHPPYRSVEFHAALPTLIDNIETGDVPEGQRGYFDINGAMFDWTSALAARTRPLRFAKAFKELFSANLRRFAKRV